MLSLLQAGVQYAEHCIRIRQRANEELFAILTSLTREELEKRVINVRFVNKDTLCDGKVIGMISGQYLLCDVNGEQFSVLPPDIFAVSL